MSKNKNIIDKIRSLRPEIEENKEFKKSLKSDLKKRAEELSKKKKKKVIPFYRHPILLTAAAAMLVIVVGAPILWDGTKRSEFDSAEVVSELVEYDLMRSSDLRVSKAVSKEKKLESFDIAGDFLAEEEFIPGWIDPQEMNTEEYEYIKENRFLTAIQNPLSTFSIDVDTASYSNVRRYINNGSLPPADSVRIEEMINYFSYDYPLPGKDKPFSVNTEVSVSPWNKDNYLVHIGLQGRDIPESKLPPSNLVFLVDASGSMDSDNKLGLLVKSIELMSEEFSRKDRVAVVAYAGAAGVVLPSTAGNKTKEIMKALKSLTAGGSTAGAQGIELAYQIAMDNFIPDGNNRVIIATDGDFNVGISSSGELTRMIEEKRDQGVYLTVLGFGMGNYKDSRMESLADSGNGNYAYIDSLLEAEKVLVTDIRKTLFVIAKDVKIQVEFNPAVVSEYRLIGYETRLLEDRDFSDDKIDAGDIGSGHTVTALYEIVPVGKGGINKDDLKYQDTSINETAQSSGELMTVALRYKNPDENKSQLIEVPVLSDVRTLNNSSDNFRFSAAVAAYAQKLRGSEYVDDYSWDEIIDLTRKSKGDDDFGYRAEFQTLLRKVKLLSK